MREHGKLCVETQGWKHSVKKSHENKLRNRANDLHDVAKYQVLHLRKNLFECWVQIFQIVSFKDNALTS